MKFENSLPENSGKDEYKKNKNSKTKEISRREFLIKSAKLSAAGVVAASFGASLAKKKFGHFTHDDIKIKGGNNIQIKKQEDKSKIKIEKKEENIADIYFDAYEELGKTELWKDDLFTNDLFMAQQLQESKYQTDAESQVGAVGVMQNMEISVKDVARYLAKLKRNIGLEYEGPEKLNEAQLEEIMGLIKKNADYSRAFGKIYMVMLSDGGYGYGVGDRKYKKGNITGAQKEILAAYNAGVSGVAYERKRGRSRKIKPESSWPLETREYCDKILNYKQRIKNIRQMFKKNNLNIDNEEIVRLAIEMDKYKSESRYTMLNRYIQSKINI